MSLMAARLGDPTVHGGVIVTGAPTVLIGGAPAARISDMHTCPIAVPPAPPHVGGIIISGSGTVYIEGFPAARMTDQAICVGPVDMIVTGCPTVLIGGPTVFTPGAPIPGTGSGDSDVPQTRDNTEEQRIQGEIEDIDERLREIQSQIEFNNHLHRSAPGGGIDPPHQGESLWDGFWRIFGATGGGVDPAPDWVEPLGGDMVRHDMEERNEALEEESSGLRTRRGELQDQLDSIQGGTDDGMIG